MAKELYMYMMKSANALCLVVSAGIRKGSDASYSGDHPQVSLEQGKHYKVSFCLNSILLPFTTTSNAVTVNTCVFLWQKDKVRIIYSGVEGKCQESYLQYKANHLSLCLKQASQVRMHVFAYSV